jgi:hypothetical protein
MMPIFWLLPMIVLPSELAEAVGECFLQASKRCGRRSVGWSVDWGCLEAAIDDDDACRVLDIIIPDARLGTLRRRRRRRRPAQAQTARTSPTIAFAS